MRPQLLETLSYTLDRLTVSLQPSLETFEGQLLQLVNDDCHNTVRLCSHRPPTDHPQSPVGARLNEGVPGSLKLQ